MSQSVSESAAHSGEAGEDAQRDYRRLTQILQEELDKANEQLRRYRTDNSVQESQIVDLRERVAGVRELQTSMKRVEQRLIASNDERAQLRTRVRELEAALDREEELDKANEQLAAIGVDSLAEEHQTIDLRERAAGMLELESSVKQVNQELNDSNNVWAQLRTDFRELELAVVREDEQ